MTVGRLLAGGGWRLAVAESLTGGLVAARLTSVAGASGWFAGGLVTYAEEAKRSLLSVRPGPVVSEEAARDMAVGVAKLLGADVGLSLTGVAGPATQDGQPVGTVFVGLSGPAAPGQPSGPGAAGAGRSEALRLSLRGDRQLVRQRAATSALNLLRRSLLRSAG